MWRKVGSGGRDRRSAEVTTSGAAWVPRAAGGFVLAAGAASLLLAQLSAGPGTGVDTSGLWLLGLLGALLCVLAWVVPWDALPAGSSLATPVAALGLLLLVDRLGDLTTNPGAAAAYPVYLLLVLTWVGLSQPRRTALAFSLCVGSVAAYVLTRHAGPALEVWSLAVILPTGVILGETAAWLAARGQALDRRELRRAGDLQRLTEFLAGLAAEDDLDAAAVLVAREATALFGCPGASVELSSAEGKRAAAEHGRLEGPATSVPLVGGRREVGRVELFLGRQHDDTAADGYLEGLARLFAIQVGTTVAQLHTINELGRAARRDALTGTGNRRHATELLGTLRPGDALLVVDLDRFKSVNDTWGHRAGDEVLHHLGTYLQACVRSSDDVARLGGDEFVVVARAAGRDVTGTAERLLRGWRQGGHRTTVSIGVALHRPDGAAEDTFDRADAALYEAKSQGRDRVALADG
ncbi:MAG: diguanylate cyclase [Acidimicrobiia bacterium]|nr:diguanylate cyclase [Acidimicrobiia bacterium]